MLRSLALHLKPDLGFLAFCRSTPDSLRELGTVLMSHERRLMSLAKVKNHELSAPLNSWTGRPDESGLTGYAPEHFTSRCCSPIFIEAS